MRLVVVSCHRPADFVSHWTLVPKRLAGGQLVADEHPILDGLPVSAPPPFAVDELEEIPAATGVLL